MPKDRVSTTHQGYGFIEFLSEEDAEYAIKVMNMVRLYGKPIRVNKVRLLSAFSLGMKAYSLFILAGVATNQGFDGRSQSIYRQSRPRGGREAAVRHIQCLWRHFAASQGHA